MADRTEVWWLQKDENKSKIALANKSGNTFTSVEAGLTVVVHGIIYSDTKFGSSLTGSPYIDINDEIPIPRNLQNVLMDGALERLYAEKPETLQVAQYWGMKYKEGVAEGKKIANKRNDGTGYRIKGEDF